MDEPIIEVEMVVVHSNEGHAWQWNQLTHELVTTQTVDDAILITTVRPKQDHPAEKARSA